MFKVKYVREKCYWLATMSTDYVVTVSVGLFLKADFKVMWQKETCIINLEQTLLEHCSNILIN